MARYIPNALVRELREALRHPIASVGGYTKAIYLSDGERICPECARENYRAISTATRQKLHDGWALLGIDIYWEGPAECCCQCNKDLPSEYGDPAQESKS